MLTKIESFNIAGSGVTAGSYTSANITVNTSGQITSASNGAVNTGPQGVQGTTGSQGVQGVQGMQGTTGIQGTIGSSGPIAGSDTQIIYNSAGTAAGSANLTFDGTTLNTQNLVLAGNLTVNGTTTTINSTTLSIDDKNIVLADGAANSAAADGAGITVAGASATLTYTSASDSWSVNKNLGIGTTSPAGPLEVIGTSGILITRSSKTASTSSSARILGGAFTGNTATAIFLDGVGGENRLNIGGGTGAGEPATSIKFYTGTAGATSAGTERMAIDASGNVGIGTTNPSAKLTVSIGTATSGTVARFSAPSYDDVYIAAGSSSASCGIGTISTSQFNIFVNSTSKIAIDNSGHVTPAANGTQNLGSTSLRWSTVYTSDLSLNNGIGDWTIVEGEDDLFIYNNRSNKVYKFKLEEVDPALATPKRG